MGGMCARLPGCLIQNCKLLGVSTFVLLAFGIAKFHPVSASGSSVGAGPRASIQVVFIVWQSMVGSAFGEQYTRPKMGQLAAAVLQYLPATSSEIRGPMGAEMLSLRSWLWVRQTFDMSKVPMVSFSISQAHPPMMLQYYSRLSLDSMLSVDAKVIAFACRPSP